MNNFIGRDNRVPRFTRAQFNYLALLLDQADCTPLACDEVSKSLAHSFSKTHHNFDKARFLKIALASNAGLSQSEMEEGDKQGGKLV